MRKTRYHTLGIIHKGGPESGVLNILIFQRKRFPASLICILCPISGDESGLASGILESHRRHLATFHGSYHAVVRNIPQRALRIKDWNCGRSAHLCSGMLSHEKAPLVAGFDGAPVGSLPCPMSTGLNVDP